VGGLAPIDTGHHVFAIVGLALGSDLAAALANRMLHMHAQIADERSLVFTIIAATTIVLLSPMLLFSRPLYRARIDATFTFGEAATKESVRIYRDIAEVGPDVGSSFKEHNHIADSLKRVRELRLIAIQQKTVLIFLAAVSVPFLLAALTQLSPRELLSRVNDLTALSPVKAK
jgi:hypothetical protein